MAIADHHPPIDPSYLRKRAVARVLGSPLVLLPTLAGIGLLALAGLGVDLGGYALTSGAVCVLLGGAMAAVRLLRFNQIAEQVREELQGQTTFGHYLYLHRLQRRLKASQDPRARQHGRELRRLYSRLERLGSAPTSGLRMEIRDKAGQLYQSSVMALERTLDYDAAAREMSTDEARRQMVQARETLLAEVGRSIANLGATLDHLQSAALRHDPTEENLARIRDDLVESLDVAKRVEDDMADLDRELRRLEGFEHLS